MTQPMNHYGLFDGAILGKSPAMTTIRECSQANAIYADLSTEAAAMGPWLTPLDAVMVDVSATLIEDETTRAAVNHIQTTSSLTCLRNHLTALRYLRPQSGKKRYFFRYSDARALTNVWSSLSPAQQAGAMGPIHCWTCYSDNEEATLLHPPEITQDNPAVALPITLSSPQFHQILERTRISELLSTTLDSFHDLRSIPAPRRREQAAEVFDWLQARRFSNDATKIAVMSVCLRMGNQALQEPEFYEAVTHADKNKDPAPILRWNSSEYSLAQTL